MALSAVRYPVLRNPSARHYAVAAAAQASSSNVNVKTLNNKITLAAVESCSPAAQVSVIYRAGSRNETYDTQGTAHLLRICTGLTTKRSSAFGLTRNIQQLGGDLSVNADRESICYTLRISRDKLEPALQYLEDAATKQLFKPWEIEDETPRIRYEVSAVPAPARLVELLYKAAYREGLGYSLYCPKRHIGKISSESLSHFVNNHYTGSRCAVVSTGVNLSDIESFASVLEVNSGEATDKAAKYLGGEVRKERNSELASVALAVEGGSLKNQKEAIAFAVLQKVAGEGPQVKWGACNTPLHKALCSASQDPFAAVAFNASHSDSGLFGLILSAPAASAGKLTEAAAKWLRAPQFTDADVARGKAALKVAVLEATDNESLLHENIAQQAVHFGNVVSIETIAQAIDSITPADVKSAANKVSKGKLSLASIGNISSVPYVEQL
ncbi:hypothetical protein TKK_0007014 [Trichogramma kaykai]|uniref:Cytochrome b-c1 complex subunit 2, mitochondrial n=1 Tax=Trichogramma kaykai TaxID=54128 RepID=A0ABD2XAG7_9HYME